jgi:hypothetical protein
LPFVAWAEALFLRKRCGARVPGIRDEFQQVQAGAQFLVYDIVAEVK